MRSSRGRASQGVRRLILQFCWHYGFTRPSRGVGSARQLDRLAQRDLAYRWIAGGVPLNYHGLSDFRVEQVEVLDRLLTESVTALIAEGVVSLSEIVVDGTKVRANAGRESFKTGHKLARIEVAVEQRLVALKAEIGADPEASSRRKRAAQERAAREVKERAGRGAGGTRSRAGRAEGASEAAFAGRGEEVQAESLAQRSRCAQHAVS